MKFKNQSEKTAAHKELCDLLNETYIKKNHDYGDSFHKSWQEEGIAMARIRLGDKMNRFKTLSRSNDRKVNDESLRDTLIDLANYALLTVLELDDESTPTDITGNSVDQTVPELNGMREYTSADLTKWGNYICPNAYTDSYLNEINSKQNPHLKEVNYKMSDAEAEKIVDTSYDDTGYRLKLNPYEMSYIKESMGFCNTQKEIAKKKLETYASSGEKENK